MALAPSTRLGPYEIVAPIGAGGMGEVYRAKDTRLDRTVAVKILRLAQYAHDHARDRFEREARAISSLSHPHICTLYDVGHQDGVEYLVMEYIAGESLGDRLRKGPLPLAQVLQYSIQIASALDAAHKRGITHRDLKPGNIMVAKDGIKLLDFGLAKIRGTEMAIGATAVATATVHLTGEGAIIGTLLYMSPEQLEGKEVDGRADIFALGAVMYEMATGRKAFPGDSQASVISSIMTASPPPISSVQRIAPPALDRIVASCLDKDPESRWQSARDLAAELRWIAERPADSVETPRRPGRRKWAGLSAAFLAVAGAAYWAGARNAAAPSTPDGIFRRLTNDPGLTTGGVLSADGKLLAYASDRTNPGNLDIWVQQVDGDGVVRITDDPADDDDPAFSPDGAEVAFRSERNGGGIYTASVLGGEARLLVAQGRRPRYSPDGRYLMYWTGPVPSDVRGSLNVKIWVRPLGGGEPTQMGAGCRVFERTPTWSPDSSRILFLGSCGSDISDRDAPRILAYVASVGGKRLDRNAALYAAWNNIHTYPAIEQWLDRPSRILVPLPVGDAGSVSVIPLSADGLRVVGPTQRVAFVGGPAERVSADRNGRIAISSQTAESHIWTVPLGSQGTASGPPRQITSGPAGEARPQVSRDGSKLVFLSMRANGSRLFYRDLASGREKELSEGGVRWETQILDPFGSAVLAVVYPNAGSWHNAIAEVAVSGGRPRVISDKRPFSWLFDWSPDRATVLLGDQGVDRYDLAAGTESRYLTPPEGEELGDPRFSSSGRWVAVNAVPTSNTVEKKASKILLAPYRAGLVPASECFPATDGEANTPRFTPDDKVILFASERDGYRCIWAQRLNSDMRPVGGAFPAYHSHERRRPLDGYRDFEIAAGQLFIARKELTGNIWLLQPAARNGR